jgi:hypothetical protein
VPSPQLVSDCSDLARYLVLLKRIRTLDCGERGSLSPTPVKQHRRRRDAVAVACLGVFSDLQEDPGKTEGHRAYAERAAIA